MAYVLIGFMGAGKSTAAIDIARAVGVAAIDSDALLAERLGHSVAREFELSGEAAFREKEEALVLELLASAGPGDVLALGGGSVLSRRVREQLAGHTTVLLDVDARTAWERASRPHAARSRPLARERDSFFALHAERRGIYEQLADAFLPQMPRRAAARALPGLRALERAGAGTRLIWASSSSGEYPVLVGEGLLAPSADTDGIWPLDRSASRSFLVTDANVAGLYEGRLGALAGKVRIEPGETNKTLATAELVWEALAGAGMTRADHLVALGGGVVGDLAGFCAATYQRGVPVVQVPTTLVAQVDSAYGGKTGVDLPRAKNYVGAYHQPAGVIADPAVLSTLPGPELAAGWAEVIKTALIAGGALWETVCSSGEIDADVIFACARTKIAIVAQDERDGGARQLLNLGHTVGHAIETVTGYSRYRHGEAVGLGLLAALRLSGRDDLRMLVSELLLARGLPVTMRGVDVDEVVAAISRDKKRTGEAVPFVLVEAPGEVRHGCELPASAAREAVAELAA